MSLLENFKHQMKEMPLRSVRSPDTLVNSIISDMEDHLNILISKYNNPSERVDASDLSEIKSLALNHQNEIELKFNEMLPDHLDERTELKDILETITSLEHVIKELLPGRIKFIIKQLEEIKQKNNAEILKFFNE